jgi:hypothetical protein
VSEAGAVRPVTGLKPGSVEDRMSDMLPRLPGRLFQEKYILNKADFNNSVFFSSCFCKSLNSSRFFVLRLKHEPRSKGIKTFGSQFQNAGVDC